MRAVGIAEEVGSGRGDHRDIDMDFSVLHRLPASAVRAQHAHAAHLALRAVVAQRAIHAAFDVMHHARSISSIAPSCEGNDALGNHIRSLTPTRAGGLQRHQCDSSPSRK